MDIINVQALVNEVSTVFGHLKGYFETLASFTSNASNPPPSFNDDVTPFVTSVDTLSTAYATKDFSANKASGYMVDAANALAALEREAGIRLKDRASYYADADIDAATEQEICSNTIAEYEAGVTGAILS